MPPPPPHSNHPPSRPTSTSPTKSKPASLYSGSPTKQRLRPYLGQRQHQGVAVANEPPQQLQRDASDASAGSRDKSVVWDSLWSLDVSYPGK